MRKTAYHPADSLSLNLGKGEMALWSGAAAFVLAAHMAGAWYLQRVPAMEAPSLDAAPAIMMELAPMVVAPEAVLTDMADVVDSAPVEQVEEVTEELDPVEEPVLEEVAEETPLETEEVAEIEPLEEVEEVVEELEEVPLPEVAMAVPQRRPVPEKPKPVEKPVKKKVEKKIEKKRPAPQVAATKSADDAPKAAAPRVSKAAAGSGMSPARWQSRVNAHLNRYKRYPRDARGIGTVTVRFTINPGGDVVGVSLAGSSGDPAFDSAALDLVRRASPVPAPPPDIAKSRMSLVVPIRYSR
ncbi:energy transducer TonB family protein [Aquamicrobium terrae]|uniref:Protein TonB n=1 Tax=Aquamicrobium terrae TaxID=1324945 RepID=A0ABV2MSR4_9HYPH